MLARQAGSTLIHAAQHGQDRARGEARVTRSSRPEVSRSPISGEVRLVEFTDLYRIREIYNDAVRYTDATLDTEPKSDADFHAWYADHQGRYRAVVLDLPQDGLVGYGSLSPFARRGGYYPLTEVSVYLAPQFRGRGYGKRLLARLDEEADRLGYATLLALITSTNTASIRLFQGAGFQCTGTLRQAGYKHGHYVSLDIYQRFLRAPGDGPPPEPQVPA
jgi:L-amino acid N-acyltransferase YncA